MSMRKISLIILSVGLFLTVSLGVIVGVWVFQSAVEIRGELERVADMGREALPQVSEIFDAQGGKIGEIGGERRYYVTLDSLPPHVPQAFISAEDKDFRNHRGISVTAIARAAYANLRGQKLSQGASTITQQLARLYFLDQKKHWQRKVKEALLAIAIEQRFSKNEILELYLNKIFLGNHSYGIEAASRNYFRKDASELSIGEAALLAGLPKSPTAYAPNRNPKRASERQAFVLRRMEEDGFLAKGDARAWSKRLVQVASQPEDQMAKAPYFVVAAAQELGRKLELRQQAEGHGFKIVTTLDPKLQSSAERSLSRTLQQLNAKSDKSGAKRSRTEGAFYSLDPRQGGVLASVGGSSFARTQYDRTRNARRHMGGLISPIYVSLALERGYTIASRVHDDPLAGAKIVLDHALGVPTIFDVVTKALTFESAPLFNALGAGSVADHAKKLGFEFARADLGLAYGLGEVTPLEVARGYAAFVNGGFLSDPHLISSIETGGQAIYKWNEQSSGKIRALTESSAYIVGHLLQEAVRLSPNKSLRDLGTSIGGIGVASDDLHDAWFVGLTGQHVTVVWLGAEDGRVRVAETAADAAALAMNIWRDAMIESGYLRDLPALKVPPQLSFARVPGLTARSQPFAAGTEPRANDTKM